MVLEWLPLKMFVFCNSCLPQTPSGRSHTQTSTTQTCSKLSSLYTSASALAFIGSARISTCLTTNSTWPISSPVRRLWRLRLFVLLDVWLCSGAWFRFVKYELSVMAESMDEPDQFFCHCCSACLWTELGNVFVLFFSCENYVNQLW